MDNKEHNLVEKKYVVESVNAKEIKANSNLFNFIREQKAANKGNVSGKPSTMGVGEIILDTEHAKYIETDDQHSYTFLVTNTPPGEGLKNVVFTSQKNGGYRTFLIQYDLTAEQIEKLRHNNETVNLFDQGPIDVTEIGGDSTPQSITQVCGHVSYSICALGNHINGELPNGSDCQAHEDIFIPILCTDIPGSGGYTAPPSYDPNTNPPISHPPGSSIPGGTGTTTPVTEPLNYMEELESCISPTLNPDGSSGIDWWGWLHADEDNNGEWDNFIQMRQLTTFLNENSCSPEAAAFGKAAAKALAEGGKVDYEEKVILDSTFVNTKAECVYDKLLSSSTDFKEGINKFEGDFPVSHLKFMGDDLGLNTRAHTIAPNSNPGTPNSPNYVITIVINNNTSSSGMNQRPNLLLAKTIIHEVIHAEMYRKIMSLIQSGTFTGVTVQEVEQALSNGDFPGIYDFFRRSQNWQHSQMASFYLNTIAAMLQEYDTNVPVTNENNIQTLYEHLAWEGLRYSGIPAWENNPNKTQINNTISNYTQNHQNETCQ